MIERMFDNGAQRLMAALIANLGEGPRWELVPNRSYGFYLWYDPGAVSDADIRAVIDDTFNFSVGVILAPRRPEHADLLPPADHGSASP